MNYCLAIAFVLSALVKQVVSGRATLYYYNRNTGEVEYNSGDNSGDEYHPPNLYTKRYFVTTVLSNSTETTPLDRRIWLLVHSQQRGLTMA